MSRINKNSYIDALHSVTLSSGVGMLVWRVLLIQVLFLPATAGSGTTNEGDFRGWTCDELTPDLCDLTITKGYIPIQENGILVRYWKYSSKKDNVDNLPPLVPVIAVHGGPGMTHNYMLPLKQLACRPDAHGRTRDVYFYDQGGCGKSLLPVNPSSNSISNSSSITDPTISKRLVEEHPYLLDPQYYATIELPRIIEYLGLEKTGYHVVANSWGTILAQYFVLNTEPKGLRSLTLSGPLSDGQLYQRSQWSETGTNNLGQLPPFVQNRLRVLELEKAFDSEEYQAIDAVLTGHFTVRTQPAPDCFKAIWDGVNHDVYVGLQGPSEFTFGGVLGNFNTTPRLHTISVPVALTSGKYDTMRPPVVETMYREIPSAEWTIFDHSGHLTMIDDAGWMNDVVDDFLTRVDEAFPSSFRPLEHLCGPKGCVPKTNKRTIGLGESAVIEGNSSAGYSLGAVLWVGIISLVAGAFVGHYLTISSANRRSAGYESL